ncbi:MAG: cytochrome c biogenesis protein CcsA [Nitrospiraceae bacterium]|nr:cytochrome c biogenesis protein CcsA [Nitrospiraceae bacterium]
MYTLLVILSLACYVFGYFRMPFVYAGFLLQTAYMVSRGLQLGRLPIIGPHDTLFFMSVSTMLFALPMTHKLKSRTRFLFPLVGLSVFFVVLSLFYKPHNAPLPPVLKTLWFEAHVALSFFSYALFGISAVMGALRLISPGEDAASGGVSVDALQYKTILTGYCFFSTAMVFGGIWAYLAWGTYWLWTPKELWTVILWLFYSLYLHARLMKWWTGRPSAVLAVTGFIIVLFTYLGVSLFMKSSHAF